MELLLSKQEMLDLGETLRGVNIICREGRCWITQAGDSRDHILGAGGKFTANSGRHIIIVATEPCRLMLRESDEQSQPSRLTICRSLRVANSGSTLNF